LYNLRYKKKKENKLRALISVSDKNGIVEFAKSLVELGFDIISTGGTFRVLKENNIDVTILNRSYNNREFFLELGCKFFDYDGMRLLFTNCIDIKYDLIVNSTSAGLKEAICPAPIEILKPLVKNSRYLFDCIYGRETPFLTPAKKEKIPYKDGEDMLLFQGVLAFELFTGVKADDSLVKAMRNGLKSS